MDEGWEPFGFQFEGFEWDNGKAKSNRRKHGIDFEDAAQIFNFPVVARPQFEAEEDRWQCIGRSARGEIVVIVTERGRYCRIISARRATRLEAGWYYKVLHRGTRQ